MSLMNLGTVTSGVAAHEPPMKGVEWISPEKTLALPWARSLGRRRMGELMGVELPIDVARTRKGAKDVLLLPKGINPLHDVYPPFGAQWVGIRVLWPVFLTDDGQLAAYSYSPTDCTMDARLAFPLLRLKAIKTLRKLDPLQLFHFALEESPPLLVGRLRRGKATALCNGLKRLFGPEAAFIGDSVQMHGGEREVLRRVNEVSFCAKFGFPLPPYEEDESLLLAEERVGISFSKEEWSAVRKAFEKPLLAKPRVRPFTDGESDVVWVARVLRLMDHPAREAQILWHVLSFMAPYIKPGRYGGWVQLLKCAWPEVCLHHSEARREGLLRVFRKMGPRYRRQMAKLYREQCRKHKVIVEV